MRALLLILFLHGAVHAETYVVRPGDSLSGIAARTMGNAGLWRHLAAANNIKDPSRLKAGMTLVIPERGGKGTSAAAAKNPTADAPREVTSAKPAPGAARPVENLFPQELRMIATTGRVVINRAGDSRDAAAGAIVRPGENVFLGEGARAVLSGSGGERLILENGAYAHLELRALSPEERSFRIRLDRGLLRLSSPVAPVASRYEIAVPSGSLRISEGDCEIEVLDAARTSVTVLDGEAHAQLPLGEVRIPSGFSTVLDTLRKPAPAIPAPRAPSLSLQSSAGTAIAAAAGRAGDTFLIEIFTDADRLERFASRLVVSDAFGVGVARFRLPVGRYHFSAQSLSADGRRGPQINEGPLDLTGER